jgi:hypothetical protein
LGMSFREYEIIIPTIGKHSRRNHLPGLRKIL